MAVQRTNVTTICCIGLACLIRHGDVTFRTEIHVAVGHAPRGCIFFVFFILLFIFRRFSKWKWTERDRYRSDCRGGGWEYQWSKRDFEICGPRSMAKDAAGTPRWRKKNNVSENWTELVKSLVVVWKLPGLRDPITGAIHVISFRREPPLRA